MDEELAAIRARTENWAVRASASWVGDEPDLGRLLDEWTQGLSHDQAARFAKLAEREYDAWQVEARKMLADALTKIYREVTSKA
jgi:hypothetical protein